MADQEVQVSKNKISLNQWMWIGVSIYVMYTAYSMYEKYLDFKIERYRIVSEAEVRRQTYKFMDEYLEEQRSKEAGRIKIPDSKTNRIDL